MPLKNLLAIKQAASELLAHEPYSEVWMGKIEVLATKILTRNSFCRSSLQVSQDLYEAIIQEMVKSLFIQMTDQRIVQKLYLTLEEGQWKQHQKAQNHLMEWSSYMKESLSKKVLLRQPNPDEKPTWVDHLAIAAREQPLGSKEREYLMDDLYFAITRFKKYRQLRSDDTAWYKDLYWDAFYDMQAWLYTGVTNQKKSCLKEVTAVLNEWPPESFSFLTFFDKRFGWVLGNFYRASYPEREITIPPNKPFPEPPAPEPKEEEEPWTLQRLEKILNHEKAIAYMKEPDMNTNHDVTLFVLVRTMREFFIPPPKANVKYTQIEIWAFVSLKLSVKASAANKFFKAHRDNLIQILTDNSESS